jgi:FecR protein
MRNLGLKTIGCLVAAAALSLPAWGMDSGQPGTAYPGTLNYVEGHALIGNEMLNSKSIGVAQMEAGQSLSTQQGRAEVLLTPGTFLRVGDNSTVRMISPDLTNTQVQVEKGEATVEVTDIHPQNNIRVDENGAVTRLVKNGFYDFDADRGVVRVFDGQAEVQVSDRDVKVKGGHELDLGSSKLKARGFDKKQYEDTGLYKWSTLRSAYLAEANADLAPTYIVNGFYGPGWIGAGWYWSPWFSCYTFLPADGVLYSPFGWGFYSPFWGYDVGLYGGYPVYHYPHRFSADPQRWGPIARTPPLEDGHIRGIAPSSPLSTNPRAFGFQGVERPAPHAFDSGTPGGFERGFFQGGAMPRFAPRGPGGGPGR